jgi:hypothetical protein
VVKVRAASKVKFDKEFWRCIRLSEGINHQCLLPIAQKNEVDAQAFFFQFSRHL